MDFERSHDVLADIARAGAMQNHFEPEVSKRSVVKAVVPTYSELTNDDGFLASGPAGVYALQALQIFREQVPELRKKLSAAHRAAASDNTTDMQHPKKLVFDNPLSRSLILNICHDLDLETFRRSGETYPPSTFLRSKTYTL